MRGLAIFLVIALLIVGGLYAAGALTGNTWWQPNSSTRPTAGEPTTENKVVGLEGAQSAQVGLTMGAGKVTVRGGAQNLMDATFTYNVVTWKPIVDYVVKGGEGRLTVRQPSGTTNTFGTGYRNDWDIRLSGTTPVDLTFKNGAGDTDMDLSDTMVRSLTVDSGASSTTIKASPKAMTNLEVKAGVGEVILDLTGDWKNSASIKVNGGVGSIKLTVPQNIGITIDAKRGVGSIDAPGFTKDGSTYRNAKYGSSAVTLNIELNVGVGSVNIVQK
jgi:predicted membrane protein